LIIDPGTLQITHVVVREDAEPYNQRLVPSGFVDEVGGDAVHLACNLEEFGQSEVFAHVEYVPSEVPAYIGADPGMLYYSPMVEVVPLVHEKVPEGKRSVYPGMPVDASDGPVGELDELLVDEESGQVTHLLLQEGHLWGRKKVLVPVAMVESAAEGVIQLKADRQTIASLLAVPAKKELGVSDVDFIVWTYGGPDEAAAGLKILRGWSKGRSKAVLAAAVVSKDEAGQVSLSEVGEFEKHHGALYGALAGGLAGLIAGPGGALLGAAAGAVAGRAASKKIDLGFPNEFLKRVEENIAPDSAAVIALVEGGQVESLGEAMAETGGALARTAVTDEMFARLAAGEALQAD
jgi:uncharacterized membrane protein